ncbi:MAG: BamA/TamA family outer membrane protein [Deltaproteobacteria bacterium]|nr:BamA/TamA family outer membrane protein [Deltaproteobacteria bacterium]
MVDTVRVQGADLMDASEVEERLATAPSPKFLGLFRGLVYDYTVFNQRTLDLDLERVERYYRARGFYDARVRSGLATTTSQGHVAVTIEVEEGLPVLVGKVTVEGIAELPEPVRTLVLNRVARTLPSGALFDEDRYEMGEERATRVLTEASYAFAKVTRRAQVDLAAHTADVTYRVVAGPTAVLGEITFRGLDGLPELPVRRAFDLRPGMPYSTSDLDAARVSVIDLGIFANVDIQPDLTPTDDPTPKIPIVVQLEAAKLHALRLGGGIELDLIRTDVHGSIGWEHGSFLGGLRKLSIELRPGLVFYPTRLPDFQSPTHLLPEAKTRVELSQPGVLEARTRGMIRAEYNIYPVLLSPEIDPSASVLGYREFRGAVGLDRTLWKLFGQVTYNFQRNDPFTYVGPLDASLSGVTLSYLDLLVQLDFRNDKLSPHKGFLVANDVQFAGGVGDARDIRVQPEARLYVPVTRRTTIALRGSVGFLFPFNYGSTLLDNAERKRLPAVDRAAWIKDVQLIYFRAFYSGGPNSNRGYALRGVGPHGTIPFFNPTLAAIDLADSCDRANPSFNAARCAQPLGGMSLWELSIEFRFPISGPLTSALFCDTSDVSPRKVNLRFEYLHLSCGTGFRYATPVGPIRLDVGYRVPGMQVLGKPDSAVEGIPGTILGVPIAVSIGIGEAF